jgi:CBS domain containing-hemolysin-like protein
MTFLILYAVLALVVSFICSLLEAGLLSLPRSYVESMVEQGAPGGKTLQKLKQNIDRPLAAILTLNTVAHTVGAAGVGAEAAKTFGSAVVGIVSAVMTLLILVFSEIIPKTLGAVHARGLAGATAFLTTGMIYLCLPLILVLEQVNRLVGYQRHRDRISRVEVLATLRLGGESGALPLRERRVAMNVMALSSVRLSKILTPRTVLFALPAEMTAAEALDKHHPLLFSRIPIYEGSIEKITGYVHRFDIHTAVTKGRSGQQLKEMQQELLIVPELASIADAMDQMLDKGEHIALAVDEYGGVEGIVTLEDIMESILGQEIIDETDPVTDMQVLARRRAGRRTS